MADVWQASVSSFFSANLVSVTRFPSALQSRKCYKAIYKRCVLTVLSRIERRKDGRERITGTMCNSQKSENTKKPVVSTIVSVGPQRLNMYYCYFYPPYMKTLEILWHFADSSRISDNAFLLVATLRFTAVIII